MSGTLFVVPTPIGNLADITERAISVLKHVDAVAAEDTRHSGRLFSHLGFKKPFISYQEHNEQQRIPQLIDRLLAGESIALISDAGTPALSDPGYRLIREALSSDVTIEVLLGASSILVALVGSGLPTDKFYFGGFLPRTSSKRQRAFSEVSSLSATLIFFESPHRIGAALRDAYEALGNRHVAVARELTKLHESFWRGSLKDSLDVFGESKVKGEIVLVINRE